MSIVDDRGERFSRESTVPVNKTVVMSWGLPIVPAIGRVDRPRESHAMELRSASFGCSAEGNFYFQLSTSRSIGRTCKLGACCLLRKTESFGLDGSCVGIGGHERPRCHRRARNRASRLQLGKRTFSAAWRQLNVSAGCWVDIPIHKHQEIADRSSLA